MLVKYKDRIYQYRMKKEISQEQLGNCLGLSKQSISNWERGIHLPKLSDIDEIAEKLGVSSEWLLGFRVYEKAVDDEPFTATDIKNVIDGLCSEELEYCKNLNTEGKQKVIQYTHDLLESNKYKKSPSRPEESAG